MGRASRPDRPVEPLGPEAARADVGGLRTRPARRSRRRAVVVLLSVGGVLAAGVLGRGTTVFDASDGTPPVVATAPEGPPVADEGALAAGATRLRAVARKDADAAPDAVAGAARASTPGGDVAPASESVSGAAPTSAAGVVALGGFLAVAPASVTDEVTGSAPPPMPVTLDDLVGRVGAFGLREGTDASRRAWTGVARVVRTSADGTEPPDDTEEPVGTAVRGRVVGEDDRPVAGAEVVLWSSFYVRQAYYDHRVRQIGRGRTDGDGRFEVRALALDTVHFGAGGAVLADVRHDAWADVVAQPVAGIAPGRDSDVGTLRLPARPSRLSGTVLDFDGRPVVGAVVVVSGAFVPVDYDKTERHVVLAECPRATTDAQGRYAIEGFAAGTHEASVHVRLDCVLHQPLRIDGEATWSPHVRAGHEVRGRVVDPDGNPVEAAVVVGGGNWTPSNADGTFWLDNVAVGPLRLEVFHHAWSRQPFDDVATDGDALELRLQRRLPRVTWTVRRPDGSPASVVAIDWTWAPGGGPTPFSPDSRYWHAPSGVHAVVVADGAVGARVSVADGAAATLGADALVEGARVDVALVAPPPPPAASAPTPGGG